MEEKLLETAIDTNTTTSNSDLNLNRSHIADDEYDSDTIIDHVNEHRDDPANLASATSRSESNRRKAPGPKMNIAAARGQLGQMQT